MTVLAPKRNRSVRLLQQNTLQHRYRVKPTLAAVIAYAHFGEVRHV